MTTPKNNIVREVSRASVFPSAFNVVSPSVSINQGDLVVFDTVANLLKLPTLEADGSTFLGVAAVTIVNGKLASPYQGTAVDAAQAIFDFAGPLHGVVVKLVSKTGDAWNPGGLAYLDPADDVQHVSSTGTKAIGVYQGAMIASATMGQFVEILLGHRFPGDTLVI